MPNERKYSTWGLVINQPLNQILDDFSILDILNNLETKGLAFIIHDRDTTQEGKAKTIHAHIVIQYNETRTHTQVIKEWANLLSYPENCISAEHVRKLMPALRYLCHLDNQEKYQYASDEVFIWGDWLKEQYKIALNQKLNLKDLLSFYKEGGTPLQIMIERDIHFWNSNRNAILDMWKMFQGKL